MKCVSEMSGCVWETISFPLGPSVGTLWQDNVQGDTEGEDHVHHNTQDKEHKAVVFSLQIKRGMMSKPKLTLNVNTLQSLLKACNSKWNMKQQISQCSSNIMSTYRCPSDSMSSCRSIKLIDLKMS